MGEGKAKYFNALPEKASHTYKKGSGDLSVKIDERGNRLLYIMLNDLNTKAETALTEGREYIAGCNEVIFKADYLDSLPAGRYTVLSAVYSKGAAVAIPIYVYEGSLPKSAVLFDPSDYNNDNLHKKMVFPRVESAGIENVRESGLPFSQCLSLTYDLRHIVGMARPAARVKRRFLSNLPIFNKVSIWIWGDNSKNRLNFFIESRDNTAAHAKNEYIIDWHGWKRLSFVLKEGYSAPLSFQQLFEFTYTPDGAQRGTVKVGKMEAIYDDSLLPDDMGKPVTENEPPYEALILDYRSGKTKDETEFFVTGAESEPVYLVAEKCCDRQGKAHPLPFERLPFDENGRLNTSIFSTLPKDLIYFLRAESESGKSSSLFPFNVSVDEPFYSESAPSPVRTVTKDNARTAAFTWLGDDENEEGFVEITDPAGNTARVNAEKSYTREWRESLNINGLNATLCKNLCSYKVLLTGLTPDSEYTARFFTGNKKSGEYKFRTFPENTDSFDLAVLVDAQIKDCDEAYPLLRKTLDCALNKTTEPRLILTLGDMVDCAGKQSEYESLSAHLQPHYAKEIWMPTPGNHDQDPKRGFDYFLAHYNLPPHCEGRANGLCFSVQIGEYALIAALGSGNALSAEYKSILEAELEKVRDSKWKIVLTHASPYGKSGERFTLINYAELFDKYKVDAVLSGHDHIYIRSSVKNGRRCEIGDGTLYCTIGPCGVSNDRSAYYKWHDYVYGDHKSEITDGEGNTDQIYAVARCEKDRFTLRAFTRTGQEVDEIVLIK